MLPGVRVEADEIDGVVGVVLVDLQIAFDRHIPLQPIHEHLLPVPVHLLDDRAPALAVPRIDKLDHNPQRPRYASDPGLLSNPLGQVEHGYYLDNHERGGSGNYSARLAAKKRFSMSDAAASPMLP